MIPRFQVEVRIPHTCPDTLGNYRAIEAFLREAGILAPQAHELRWRLDVERPGYILSYSVSVPQSSPVTR